MTVKELFQSLHFNEIIEPLVLKYPNALKPMSEYKENYDIILNTAFSGEGGTITFHTDGDSDAYMVEGDRYFNIVGMEVVLPENGAVTKAEAAAEILWCAAPFGRYPIIDWGDLFEEHIADYYTLQAKRLDLKIALPYCRDKKIRRELKHEMKSQYADLSLSAEATEWFIDGKGKVWGRIQNRSKRKREYRMRKRYKELVRLEEAHNQLSLLETKIGEVPERIKNLVLTSLAIENVNYTSQSNGQSDRIQYIADLLLNPLYNGKRFLDSDRSQQCVCVIFTSPEHPCTEEEKRGLLDIINSYFDTVPWQLFMAQDLGLDNEIELDITYITQ